MPLQRLVIDGNDQRHFFVSVQDGTLTIGGDSAHAETVIADLSMLRIRCELEFDAPQVLVGDLTTNAAPPQPLHPGEALQVGHAKLRLAGLASPAAADAGTAHPQPRADVGSTATSAAQPADGMIRRLIVIEGPDHGRTIPFPVSGHITVGNSPKHADVVLQDGCVARLHCALQIDRDRVVAAHREGGRGTFVNDKRVAEQELKLGDILRIGNTQLRLELGKAEPRAVEPPLDMDGKVLGQYQFGALLGRGHSGLVFRAHQRQTNQPVAVKVLSPDFPKNDVELQGFVRAMKIVAPLRHPHLVAVHSVGKSGPYCWIARDFIEGENLSQHTTRLHAAGKLGWKAACRVAVQLGQVLDFLHQKGITHGNLTPANVLVSSETEAVFLSDLMLDKALEGSTVAELVREKKLLAELPCYAPEQIEQAAAPDQRTCIYALGTMLYGFMTGRQPFTGTTPQTIIADILEAKVTAPSKYQRDIPPPFEAAVLKMLARRPEDRYQTAAEMLAVVEPIANIHEIKV